MNVQLSGLLLAVAFLSSPVAAQCTSTRGSVDGAGVEGNLGSGLTGTALNRTYVSASGRYVAFWSAASNLVANDTNGKQDVFVRDLVLGTVERVSVDSAGVEGDGDSTDPSISADGRVVAFQTLATNLAAGDTNGRLDVYVRDRVAGTTTRVSLDANGVEGDHDSTRADVSADGLVVGFQSRATNWVAGDVNNKFDAFVKVLASGALECVSLNAGGVPGNNTSGSPALSGNGRFIAFHSLASDLAAGGDLNANFDVFLRDRQTGSLERLSVGPLGEEADYFSQTPSITPDGRYVAFSSSATNLVVGDTNNVFDVFVRDTVLDHTVLVSVDDQGYLGNSTSQGSSISADGRFVAFQSSASNLVLGDTNGGPFNLEFDVFVRDRLLRTTTRFSIDEFGAQAVGSSFHPCIASDASVVAFYSDAANIVAADANAARDLFLKACSAAPLPVPFCSGDGTGTACPCGNAGNSGRGCDNSFGTGGAWLEGVGSSRVSSDTLVFQSYGLTPAGSVLLFQGTEEQSGGLGVVFGDGLRCAGGSVTRLGSRFASGGSVAFGHGVPGDAPISVNGAIPAGTVSIRTYQIWYRNVADFCTPSGFNLTNGVRVTWTP